MFASTSIGMSLLNAMSFTTNKITSYFPMSGI